MPRPKYTAEQIAITKAMIKANYSPATIQELLGVTAATIHAIKHNRVKQGSAADRVDADFARRLTTCLRRVRWRSMRAMADAFQEAANDLEAEIKQEVAQ